MGIWFSGFIREDPVFMPRWEFLGWGKGFARKIEYLDCFYEVGRLYVECDRLIPGFRKVTLEGYVDLGNYSIRFEYAETTNSCRIKVSQSGKIPRIFTSKTGFNLGAS